MKNIQWALLLPLTFVAFAMGVTVGWYLLPAPLEGRSMAEATDTYCDQQYNLKWDAIGRPQVCEFRLTDGTRCLAMSNSINCQWGKQHAHPSRGGPIFRSDILNRGGFDPQIPYEGFQKGKVLPPSRGLLPLLSQEGSFDLIELHDAQTSVHPMRRLPIHLQAGSRPQGGYGF